MRSKMASPSGYPVPTVGTRILPITWTDLLLATAGGIAVAVISQLLGRAFHAAYPVPTSGSVVAALPRAVVLLVLLTRTKSFGVLTVSALAEASTKLAWSGFGIMPWFVVVPLLGNLAGDVAWASFRSLVGRRARLMVTGAVLCTARVLAALVFWALAARSVQHSVDSLAAVLMGIVAINIIMGLAAGVLVHFPTTRLRREHEA